MTVTKEFAAKSLAGWFKAYRTPTQQFEGPGLEALITCAITSIQAINGDGATEDEISAFIEGIQFALAQEALVSLLRDGRVVATVKDGELAFSALE